MKKIGIYKLNRHMDEANQVEYSLTTNHWGIHNSLDHGDYKLNNVYWSKELCPDGSIRWTECLPNEYRNAMGHYRNNHPFLFSFKGRTK
jgi:hypothetical protein